MMLRLPTSLSHLFTQAGQMTVEWYRALTNVTNAAQASADAIVDQDQKIGASQAEIVALQDAVSRLADVSMVAGVSNRLAAVEDLLRREMRPSVYVAPQGDLRQPWIMPPRGDLPAVVPSGTMAWQNYDRVSITGGVATLSTLTVTDDGGLILKNQTDAAAANAGTLTNAPSVGDPAMWAPVSFNGVVYAFPLWSI